MCERVNRLTGREPHGIVDPADKYELEEQIISDLYSIRSEETGHRVVAVALHNKDAVLLGMGGAQCGDIVYWIAEGYNADHTDSLSTTWGEADTSVSLIFIASGKGLKQAFTTERVIRQTDLVPTMCVLGNVRMPRNCEGAPVFLWHDEHERLCQGQRYQMYNLYNRFLCDFGSLLDVNRFGIIKQAYSLFPTSYRWEFLRAKKIFCKKVEKISKKFHFQAGIGKRMTK